MLTLYRASAGAGKTYKLTEEYLKLLFKHPYAYRRILAVTFTNKATDEMKERIISELFNLSSGAKSGYIATLTKDCGFTEEALRLKAKQTLVSILHDYSAFNISTIDSFFQQTMRAFTREIGLQGGYGIEMDQNVVLVEAVDNMLAGLDKSDNKELLSWLLRFAEDKIENGGEWNLRREIMMLSREVFKESYKSFSDDLAKDIEDKVSLNKYRDELQKIITSVKAEAKRLGEKGLAVMEQYGLQPSDFKGGSRSSMMQFQRWAGGEMKEPTATFLSFEDNTEACYTKTTPDAMKQIIGCALADGLNDCIKAIIALYSDLTYYNTAAEIIRYYYTLGILNDISRQIAEYREEKNTILIADTTELLNRIIDGSDTPFIYEKTGTRVDHYMIDEFQDTSRMQWENFRPLLRDSLAQSQDNLIVGDVKQSIYRFRNSDWTLLDGKIQTEFSPEQLTMKSLDENWRSFANVVNFNNAFFTSSPEILQEQYNEVIASSSLSDDEKQEYISRITSAYNGSTQSIPDSFKDKAGHVQVSFLTEEEGSNWMDEALQRLPETIERLQDNGYQLKDIAILVRTNNEGASVAETLLKYKDEHQSSQYNYDIISDEALFVNSSAVVRFVVALLKHIKSPDDEISRSMAYFAYVALSDNFDTAGENRFPQEIATEVMKLSRLSLYEMVEGIYRTFAPVFPDNEQVFVQAFLDIVADFTKKENADIARFLKWWEETGCRKTIATPDGQNAIRIMTIHKSKGLGFKVVLIPFCDWEIDHRPTKNIVLWCRPSVAPFDRLPLVPVRYGQILANTIFANDYFNEKLHAFIDNLNTLYVAFTRTKEELIVFAPRPKKLDSKEGLTKANSIADLLWLSLPEADFDKEEGFYESGDWCKAKQSTASDNIRELPIGQLHSISSQDRLHLRLNGRAIVLDDEQRKFGVLMHDILSCVETIKDVDKVITRHYLSGAMNKEEAAKIKQTLSEHLSRDDVKGWFDGSHHVLNEIDILYNNGLTRRPDRVMIKDGKVTVVDYKFGEKDEKKYSRQVKSYIDLIRQIGYKEVEGYLWYVQLNELIRVKD